MLFPIRGITEITEFVTPISWTSVIMSSLGQPEFFCKGLAKRPSNWPFATEKGQCLSASLSNDLVGAHNMTCSHHSWTFQLTPLAKLCHIHVFFFSRCLVRIGLVQQMPRCTSFAEPVSFDGFGCAQTKTIMKIHTTRHLQWYCTSLSLACFVLEQRPLVALSQSLLDPAYGSHLSSRCCHMRKKGGESVQEVRGLGFFKHTHIHQSSLFKAATSTCLTWWKETNKRGCNMLQLECETMWDVCLATSK